VNIDDYAEVESEDRDREIAGTLISVDTGIQIWLHLCRDCREIVDSGIESPGVLGLGVTRKQIEYILAGPDDLGQAFAMAAGLSKNLADDLRIAKETIAEMLTIIEAVCKHSVAIPAKQRIGKGPRDHYQVEQLSAIDFSEVTGGMHALSAGSFRHIDLYALRVFLESRYEQFQAAVHLEYLAGPHSAYMISDKALWSLPRETLLRRLAPDIGRLLIDHLRKNGGN